MGLDMFFYGVKFISEYDENNKEGKAKIIKTREIYWRKANHIHKWFVDNVQYGNDDCGTYTVSVDDLIKLRSLCEKVLKNKSMAKYILPTQPGFFFGTTDYDDYYFYYCEETAKDISRILDEKNDYDWFEYHSSW